MACEPLLSADFRRAIARGSLPYVHAAAAVLLHVYAAPLPPGVIPAPLLANTNTAAREGREPFPHTLSLAAARVILGTDRGRTTIHFAQLLFGARHHTFVRSQPVPQCHV